MKYIHTTLLSIFFCILTVSGTFGLAYSAHAAVEGDVQGVAPSQQVTYTPLSPIAGVNDPASGGSQLSKYLPNMFMFLIAIAGVLAVVVIVIGGVRYMSTDAIYGKHEGKEMIQQALGGLVLALVAWLILYSINPALLKTTLGVPDPESVTQQEAPTYTYSIRTFTYPLSGPNSQQTFCNGTFTNIDACTAAIPSVAQSFPPSQYQIVGEPTCVSQCVPSQVAGGEHTTQITYDIPGAGHTQVDCVGSFSSKPVCDDAMPQTIAPYMSAPNQYLSFSSVCKPLDQCNPVE